MLNKNLPHRFDFDIGHLVKSPCGKCELREHFPGCAATCAIIEKIQARLAGGISCSKRD